PMFFWWWLVQRPRQNFFTVAKTRLIPVILKFNSDFRYHIENKAFLIKLQNEIKHHAIFPRGSYLTARDWITGQDGQTHIHIMEAFINKGRDNVFRGVIIMLYLPFNTSQELVLSNH